MTRNTPEYWAHIREFYRTASARPDPYRLMGGDWPWTPIEREAWWAFRTAGMFVLPEYPVGRRFVDFANPDYKIAIELDGAEWHSPEKDAARDRELAALGWATLRVPGRLCWVEFSADDPTPKPWGLESLVESLATIFCPPGAVPIESAPEIVLAFVTEPGRDLLKQAFVAAKVKQEADARRFEAEWDHPDGYSGVAA